MQDLVIVTGAGGAIGEAIATTLMAAGWAVAGLDLRFAEDGAALTERVVVDITDNAALRAAITTLGQKFRIAGLVNCAGVSTVGRFAEQDEALWQRLIAVNYLAALVASHAVLPFMTAAQAGAIINIGSDSARVGAGGEAVYAGAKAALVGFGKSLAQEVGRFGITVNCVSPGPVATPMSAPHRDVMDKLAKRIPLGRVGLPEDVAGAVAFLMSPAACYMTGQVLSVSGGLTMVG